MDLQEGSSGLSWASTIISLDIIAGHTDCPTTAVAPTTLSTKKLFVCCHFHPLPPLLAAGPLQVAALHNPSRHPEERLAASLHMPPAPYSYPHRSQKNHLSLLDKCVKPHSCLGTARWLNSTLHHGVKEKESQGFVFSPGGKKSSALAFFSSEWCREGGGKGCFGGSLFHLRASRQLKLTLLIH